MNLIATIVFPLVISTFLTLSENPEMIFCMDYTATSIFFKSLIRIFILHLFLLVPALIVNAVDVVKETIDDMINKKSTITQEIYEKYFCKLYVLKRLQRKLLAWLKAELGAEIVYQVVIQFILLMMYETHTPTQRGIDAIFAKDSNNSFISSQVLLIFSIIWSLKTCITTHIKATKVEKEFLPFTSALVLFAQTTVGTVKRIGTLFFYFVPFFGNLNLLQHWKAELKPWKAKPFLDYKDDLMYVGNISIPWRDINRADYTDPTNPTTPDYTLYTGLSLGDAYIIFLLLLYLQLITVFLCKLYTAEEFKRKGFLQKILHSGELQFSLPCAGLGKADSGHGGPFTKDTTSEVGGDHYYAC